MELFFQHKKKVISTYLQSSCEATVQVSIYSSAWLTKDAQQWLAPFTLLSLTLILVSLMNSLWFFTEVFCRKAETEISLV